MNIQESLYQNIMAVWPGQTEARIRAISERIGYAFETRDGSEDLYEYIQEVMDRHFDSDDKNNIRYYFHSTALERYADIAMETFKKHNLIQDDNEYNWWSIKLPA